MTAGFAGRRVLVTGATGFVGSALVRALLSESAEVHGLSRGRSDAWRLQGLGRGLHLHESDLTDAAAVLAVFRRVRPALVFHAATFRPVDGDMAAMAAAHVLGTAHLLTAACELRPQRLVHLTTNLEYGEETRPLTEDLCPRPSTAYGVTKLAATRLVQHLAAAERLSTIVLRLFHVYGPGEPPTRLVPAAIRAGLAGGELPLTQGTWRRDYVFVADVVDACLRAASWPAATGQIVNVGSGTQHSNAEVVRLVRRLTGGRLVLRRGQYPARARDRRHWVADVRRAQELLGWMPRHSLEKGLVETIAWTRAGGWDRPAGSMRPA